MHKLKLRHFNKLVIEICIIFIVIFMINLIIKIKTITVGQNLYTLLNYCDNNKIPYKEVMHDSFIFRTPLL